MELLFQLERLYGYENPKRGLSTVLRPAAVAWWSSRGRPNRLPKSPQIESVEGFSKEVRTYWESINPEWRHGEVAGSTADLASLKLKILIIVLSCFAKNSNKIISQIFELLPSSWHYPRHLVPFDGHRQPALATQIT